MAIEWKIKHFGDTLWLIVVLAPRALTNFRSNVKKFKLLCHCAVNKTKLCNKASHASHT